jgi:hypothetical protein
MADAGASPFWIRIIHADMNLVVGNRHRMTHTPTFLRTIRLCCVGPPPAEGRDDEEEEEGGRVLR